MDVFNGDRLDGIYGDTDGDTGLERPNSVVPVCGDVEEPEIRSSAALAGSKDAVWRCGIGYLRIELECAKPAAPFNLVGVLGSFVACPFPAKEKEEATLLRDPLRSNNFV